MGPAFCMAGDHSVDSSNLLVALVLFPLLKVAIASCKEPRPTAVALLAGGMRYGMRNPTSFPRSAKCERCGQMAIVVAWVPSGKPANQTTGADESKTNVVTCRIDCPKCGTHVQAIEFSIN